MKILFLAITCITILTFFFVFFSKKDSHSGIVIILNGPSASGKSSIQKEFQKLMMPNLWIKLGIDNLFDSPMPEITLENLEYWQNENPIRWVTSDKDKEGNPVITLHVGPAGEKVAIGMNEAIASYAENGCNLIVDYIGYNDIWLYDLIDRLAGVKTYWVKVEIPLETLEEREVVRATSPKGHARSHFDTVYANISYDLVVNSGKNSAAEIAQQIKTTFNL